MSEKFYVRRKPVHVQAEQFRPAYRMPSFIWASHSDYYYMAGNDDEETFVILPGDYIITDKDGNRTVCKQEDFERDYEPA